MSKIVDILIADDHELLRDGIKVRLENHPGFRVCAQTHSGREAVELAIQLRPDIAIIDIGIPELNGIEATIQILEGSPTTKVLILTMQESETILRSALTAGALGFLLKTDAGRLLFTAVETLMKGQPFFTGRVSEVVLSDFLHPETRSQIKLSERHQLTRREREITQLLAESNTGKEVAIQLGVSIKTVEAHRANIMRKLNIHSIAELVRYAVRNKIIEP